MPESNSTISEADSTAIVRPLRSAQQVISKLQSLESLVVRMSSQPSLSKAEKQKILKLAQDAKLLRDWAKIETCICSANEKQIEALEAFESGEYDTIAMLGANRSGKSVCLGRMCFAKHLRDKALPGEIYWCVAPTIEKSVSGQQKELYQCLPSELIGDQKYDEKNGFGQTRPTLIVDPNGRRVIVRFKSSSQFDDNPQSFEQEKVAGIWIDESIQEHIYETLIPRVLDSNGFILMSTIPDIPWMFDRFENADIKRLKFIKLAMIDNAVNLSKGAVERAVANLSADEAQMRVFGNFRFVSGLVYREFTNDYKPNGHLIQPFTIPREWPKWRMMDVGMDHPTACLWATVSPNETIYIYREYFSRNTSIAHDADRIVSMSGTERYASPVIIDPTSYNVTKASMRSVAQQYAECGLQCTPGPRVQHSRTGAVKGEEALIMLVKKRLENQTMFVFDTCTNLIKEFRRWSFKRDAANRPMGNSVYEDKWNDGLDALKLFIGTRPTSRPYKLEMAVTYD